MVILSGAELAEQITTLMKASGKLRCAVAFWGPKIGKLARKKAARVVLDISMNCTTRNALKSLGAPENKSIKVLDGLHAKLFLGDEYAIIGSANATTNALGYEGKAPRLRELGIRIDRAAHPDLYQQLEQQFETYWKFGRAIDDADMERAPRAPSSDAAKDTPKQTKKREPSVLNEVFRRPERFASTGFVFADSEVDIAERRMADEVYQEESINDPSAGRRQFLCSTNNFELDVSIQECAYIIMFWLGAKEPGIWAYHDIVRVEFNNGMVAFYGQRHWPTVRDRLGISNKHKKEEYWICDRVMASKLANRCGDVYGERFELYRSDEIFEVLEDSA